MVADVSNQAVRRCAAAIVFIGIVGSLLVRIGAFGLSESHGNKVGSMTRMLHRKSTYVWVLIVALVVAGAVVVARTLGAIDSFDGI